MGLDTATTLSLLRPLVGLNLWTFIVEIWMYYVRIIATSKSDIKYTPQFTKQYFYSKIPPAAQWPGDNYTHLMEQPTQFYAIVVALILAGDESQTSVTLAWAYVFTRVLHSVVHGAVNYVQLRSLVFTASSLILLGLGLRAAAVVF